jgi:hypothetical protein
MPSRLLRSGGEVTATKRGLTVFVLALAGSALLGAVAGLIWGAVAPRALFQVVTQGEAQLANPETSAYVAADIWFCVIAAVGGLITGLAGVRLLVRKDGWPAAAGLVLGAVAAAFTMMWIGGLIGLSTYNHQLATAGANAYFNDSLALSAKSALSFWPLVASAIIALTSAGSQVPVPLPGDPDAVSGMWTQGQADGHAP